VEGGDVRTARRVRRKTEKAELHPIHYGEDLLCMYSQHRIIASSIHVPPSTATSAQRTLSYSSTPELPKPTSTHVPSQNRSPSLTLVAQPEDARDRDALLAHHRDDRASVVVHDRHLGREYLSRCGWTRWPQWVTE
jgi:hypothetical protein